MNNLGNFGLFSLFYLIYNIFANITLKSKRKLWAIKGFL